MTNEELVWLAGLLEGEGYFRLGNGNSPCIVLCMTDRDVVIRAQNIMGGNLSTRQQRPNHKLQYILRLYGRPALVIMKLLLPEMGLRRAQKIAAIIETNKKNKVRAWKK